MRIFSILVLATLVALVACQNTDSSKKDTKTASASANLTTADNKNVKLAFVNIDSLIENYAFTKEIKKDLDVKGRTIDSELSRKSSELQSEYTAYQRNVGGMTNQQAQDVEQNLKYKQQELGQRKQSLESDFMKEQQEKSKKMNDNINDYIKKYAEKNGYTFIFSYSKSLATSGIVYGQEAYDVTLDVLKGLNEEYKNSGSTEKKK